MSQPPNNNPPYGYPPQQYPPQQYPPQQYPPQQYPPQQYPPQQYPPQQYPPQQYPPQQYPPQQYPPQQYPPQQYPPQQHPPQQYPPQQYPPQQYPPQQQPYVAPLSPQQPYVAPQQPYGQPQQPYVAPQQPYGQQPQQPYVQQPQQPPQQVFAVAPPPQVYTFNSANMAQHATNTAYLYVSHAPAPANPSFNPTPDAEALYHSMKGLGTDDKVLSNIIATRSKPQLLAIKAAFQTKYGKTLEKFIQGDTSGNYQDILIALIQAPDEYDAQLVRDAVKGLGTNDTELVEVVCTRNNTQLKAMKAAYSRLYGKDLEKDVADDTSGDYRNLLMAILRADRPETQPVNVEEAKKDAQTLYQAGEGRMGTDEKTFIQILSQRSIPQLLTINSCYAQITGHSLEKGIAKETSGNFKKALVTLLTPREEYFATAIRDAIDGAGTKDKKLVRVLAYLSENVDLFKAVNAFYTHRWKNTLQKDVGGDTSGWYKKTNVALIQNRCNI